MHSGNQDLDLEPLILAGLPLLLSLLPEPGHFFFFLCPTMFFRHCQYSIPIMFPSKTVPGPVPSWSLTPNVAQLIVWPNRSWLFIPKQLLVHPFFCSLHTWPPITDAGSRCQNLCSGIGTENTSCGNVCIRVSRALDDDPRGKTHAQHSTSCGHFSLIILAVRGLRVLCEFFNALVHVFHTDLHPQQKGYCCIFLVVTVLRSCPCFLCSLGFRQCICRHCTLSLLSNNNSRIPVNTLAPAISADVAHVLNGTAILLIVILLITTPHVCHAST